jgi:nucleotide-binding universal stress UspA family protein
MENIRNILVISRMSSYSLNAIHLGISLARKYDANLMVLHLVSNPVDMMAVHVPDIFPEDYVNYMYIQQDAKETLEKVIKKETTGGFPIKELISELDTVEEVVRVVSEEKIDLIIMLAHQEGRLEHALFGGENDAIIRRIPCSIMLVKNEPESVEW